MCAVQKDECWRNADRFLGTEVLGSTATVIVYAVLTESVTGLSWINLSLMHERTPL